MGEREGGREREKGGERGCWFPLGERGNQTNLMEKKKKKCVVLFEKKKKRGEGGKRKVFFLWVV